MSAAAVEVPASKSGQESPGQDSPRSPGGGQERNRQIVKAIILGPVVKQELTTGQTKEIPPDDILGTLMADGRIVTPPFDKLVLAMMPEQSTALGQVIDAMVQNTVGFGFKLSCRVNIEDPECPPELKAAVEAEKVMLTNFFNNCCMDYSFDELRKRTRHDVHSTGEGYWEVIRLPSNNAIVQLNHIVSHQVRLGYTDKDFTTFKRKVAVLQADGSIKLEEVMYRKRFRRFVQARIAGLSRAFSSSRGYEVVWFKEYQDPRTIDNRDGSVVPDDKLADFPEEFKAGELMHWKLYSPRTPYGLPKYIGNLITLFGDRAADEINFITMKNNNIPSMVVLVSNGQLTASSIARIQEFVETQVSGSDNFSRFLLLEGEGQFEGSDTGHVKIDVKPLTQEQMRDQMFQEYGKNNRDKLREAYRLPPILVGRSQDYTRATADTSRKLADEQIFKPERDEDDRHINKFLMPDLGVVYHYFKSNGANVTDDQDLIKVLADAERTGGMTPRLARFIIADILNMDSLPPLSPDIDPDVPFTLQVAEAVKNTAPPGAQLAVKSMMGGYKPEDVVAVLLGLRTDFETALAESLSSQSGTTADAG